jgi:hypothetical protein
MSRGFRRIVERREERISRFSGLMWATPLRQSPGIVVVILLSAGGFRWFTSVEIALPVLASTCYRSKRQHVDRYACDSLSRSTTRKLKDQDGRCRCHAVTIGGAIAVAILLWPHVWAAIHR